MVRTVFLDRDGVVNKLCYHQELEVRCAPFIVNQFKLLSGVPEAINSLHRSGYLVILISNQPDIGLGYMTLDDFEKIKQKMNKELIKAGAYLDGEYYCMHHPEAVIEKYKVTCDCRKPNPGLLLRAAREHNVDMPYSWFVGDYLSDVEAGKSAGCRTVLINKKGQNNSVSIDSVKAKPDIICANITEAAQHILQIKIEYVNNKCHNELLYIY
jgi:D-glycero-D-manno-heptose 1,7-bisphosphate phosphatase